MNPCNSPAIGKEEPVPVQASFKVFQMLIRKVSLLAIAALAAVGAIGVVAQDAFTPPTSTAEAHDMRVGTMEQMGRLLRSAGQATGDEAVAAAQTLLTSFTNLPEMFPEGSVDGTDALPEIWQDWETFTGIIETGRSAAEAALAAAEAGDTETYATSLRTLMGTCNQCHQQFRS